MRLADRIQARFVSTWIAWSPYAENTFNLLTIIASYERG